MRFSVYRGFGEWYLAKTSLDRETDANVNQIKSKNEEIKTVKNFPDHPNEQFVAGMDRIIQPYSYEVGLGWKKRYDQQVKYLVWPQSLIEEAEGFLDQVKDLRPIEKVPYPTPREKEIPTTYLTVYRNFITLELPKLAQNDRCQMVCSYRFCQWRFSIWPPRSGGIYGAPGGAFSLDGGAGAAALEKDNSVVMWSEENQKQILETHFGFASRNQNPTTLEVLYAQEDLWVLQAIMQIIKKTNGNVDANYDAAVKAIDSLQIGRTARGRMGQITPIMDKSATGGPEAMSMMPGGARVCQPKVALLRNAGLWTWYGSTRRTRRRWSNHTRCRSGSCFRALCGCELQSTCTGKSAHGGNIH